MINREAITIPEIPTAELNQLSSLYATFFQLDDPHREAARVLPR